MDAKTNGALVDGCRLLLEQYDASGDFTMGGKLTNQPFSMIRASLNELFGNPEQLPTHAEQRELLGDPARLNVLCEEAFMAEDGYGDKLTFPAKYSVYRDGFFGAISILNELSGNSGKLPDPLAALTPGSAP